MTFQQDVSKYMRTHKCTLPEAAKAVSSGLHDKRTKRYRAKK